MGRVLSRMPASRLLSNRHGRTGRTGRGYFGPVPGIWAIADQLEVGFYLPVVAGKEVNTSEHVERQEN